MKNLRYRFDSMILYFFMLIILVAGSSFAYKFYTVRECPDIAFQVSEQSIEAGQMIMFTNKTAGVNAVAWDFGDNSRISRDFHSAHTYQEPGEYTLRLTVNDRCSELRRIVVLPKKELIDETLVPRFKAPANVEINQKLRFRCTTKEAESFEWRFGETGKVDSRERNPQYQYSSPGLKTVSLVINGNEKYIARQTVHVLLPSVKAPKKEAPAAKPEGDKRKHIPDSPTDWSIFDEVKPEPIVVVEKKEVPKPMKNDALMAAIQEHTQGMMKLSDFKYTFCEKVETSLVEANGKLMKFPDFLESVKGYNLKVKEFRTIRGEEGCVMQVIIRYKK